MATKNRPIPTPIANVPVVAPMRVLLPTNKYPHLKDLIFELDYVCSTCTSGAGAAVYRTLAESRLDPAGGPGQYDTRVLIQCPVCKTVPEDGPYFEAKGIVDLLTVPKEYKRPPRPASDTESGIVFENEDEAMVAPDDEKIDPPSGSSKAVVARTGRKKTTKAKAKTKRKKAQKKKR